MQDRFKFRCILNNEIKDIYYFYELPDNKNIVFVCTDFKNGRGHYIPKTQLIQCTGLKDKNGKRIHESDIVYKKGSKNYKKEKMYSLVCWDCMYAQFNISDENGLHQMPSNSNNIEVIGNIYENPELLNDNQKRAENLITNPESEILDSIKRVKIKTDICKTIKELIDNE